MNTKPNSHIVNASHLKVAIAQYDIVWECPEENIRYLNKHLSALVGEMDLLVLPEMFNNGFSFNVTKVAETMEGESVRWMLETAKNLGCVVVGSLAIHENQKYFNRMVWASPEGHLEYYNKKHLFSFAGEDKFYAPGTSRNPVQVKGWGLSGFICFDLRFPIWSRVSVGHEYDALIYIASWPATRREHWLTLLKARALENQCYVIGVNRLGVDGNKLEYCGDSVVFDPMGRESVKANNRAAIFYTELSKETLLHTRRSYPFLREADNFILED